MAIITVLVATCLLLLRRDIAVNGYNWESENGACTSLQPDSYSKMTEIDDKEYYRIALSHGIQPSSNTFHPGGKVYVRIMGKNAGDMYTYNGFILTVTEANETSKVAGAWDDVHSRKFKRIPCFAKANAAVVETDEPNAVTEVAVEEDVLVWLAPDDCTPGSFYDLKGSVVRNSSAILTGLSLRIQCVEKTVLDLPHNSCDKNFTEGDPSATSFETGFDEWWNDPKHSLRWARNKGSTPSPFTGPSSAFEGEYYVYTEGSYPAREGDEASLNSPPGLNGCFCVRVKCHMWGGRGTYFSSRVNGIEMWSHTASGNEWLTGWQSVNDANHPVVQLAMHRGLDFRGDVALDSVEILPGLCVEDVRGGGLPIWEKLQEKGAK